MARVKFREQLGDILGALAVQPTAGRLLPAANEIISLLVGANSTELQEAAARLTRGEEFLPGVKGGRQ